MKDQVFPNADPTALARILLPCLIGGNCLISPQAHLKRLSSVFYQINPDYCYKFIAAGGWREIMAGLWLGGFAAMEGMENTANDQITSKNYHLTPAVVAYFYGDKNTEKLNSLATIICHEDPHRHFLTKSIESLQCGIPFPEFIAFDEIAIPLRKFWKNRQQV